jgi:Protein of unknown function (DUF3108)
MTAKGKPEAATLTPRCRINLTANNQVRRLARDTIGGDVRAAWCETGRLGSKPTTKDRTPMLAFAPLARTAVFALIPAFALTATGLDRAHAQGKLSVAYTISAARIPVGKITWSADIGADSFTTTGSGEATGLASLAVSGKGSATARGIVQDGRLYTTSFTSNMPHGNENSELTMVLDHGAVTELKSAPPLPGDDRVPVTAAHRQNIVDPLTAWLIPAGAGGGLDSAACERTLPIFDGQRRFDLKLAFRRMDKVKADKGYQGQAVVCAVTFQPIAGHRASSTLVNFLSNGRDIEVWLAPATGTGFLAPFRVVVASMLGNIVVQANEFQALAQTAPVTPDANARKD